MDKWLGVELRLFATLAAIEEERSFRGAAKRLGYVQSAVSQQLSRLELLVGTRLVERSRGQATVELTDAGRLVLARGRRILAQLWAAKTDLRTLAEGDSGILRVGAFQSAATRIVPRVLSRLAAERPDVRVSVTETQSDESLFAAVERGELDAAFAELPLKPGPFQARELLVDPSVLVVSADSPFAHGPQPPTLAEIAGLPLITCTTWRMPELIERHFLALGPAPRPSMRSETNAAVQALAAARLGCAIMPRLAVDENDPSTAVIDLSGVLPSRTVVVYWHRARIAQRPALTAFADAAEGVCRKLWEAVEPLGTPSDVDKDTDMVAMPT